MIASTVVQYPFSPHSSADVFHYLEGIQLETGREIALTTQNGYSVSSVKNEMIFSLGQEK